MHDTNSEYIVNFYGAFLSDTNDVIMCMEYMDVGYVFQFEIQEAIIIDVLQFSGQNLEKVWSC